MAIAQKALKWTARYLRWKNPFQKGAQEASDQYLGKKAKVQTLTDLVLTRDLDQISEAEHEAVAALRAKHGFGKKMGLFGGKSGDRNLMAADDVSIHGSNFAELLLAILIGAAAMWYFNKPNDTAAAAPPTTPVEMTVPDSAYDVLFFDREGNQITVPRLPAERLPEHLRDKAE